MTSSVGCRARRELGATEEQDGKKTGKERNKTEKDRKDELKNVVLLV
jgi:hypothetical protein